MVATFDANKKRGKNVYLENKVTYVLYICNNNVEHTKISQRGYGLQITESVLNTSISESNLFRPQDT